MRTNKNRYGNALEKYESLIKKYKKLWPRYQKCILVPFGKNSSYYTTQPNETKKAFWNGLQNAIPCRILL